MIRRHPLPSLLVSISAVLLSAHLLFADETAAPSAAPAFPQIETIVCIRHGEKPANGIGNLDVQGLNRSLALPDMLLGRYGKPAYIFAPDPAADKIYEGPAGADGKKEAVSYIRPLITIGPTAIRCGLPVNASYGFKHIADLERELDQPPYRTALVFVAWEHVQAQQFIKNEVRDHGGNPDVVPVWGRPDFDSIYVVKISRDQKGAARVTFQLDHEGLNGLSGNFPKPAAK